MGLTDSRMEPAYGAVYRADGGIVNVGDKWEEGLGQAGFKVITTTDATTPGTGKVFVAFQCLSQTVISALTAHASAPISGTITGVTLAAGTVFFGRFTTITLTSGNVIAYLGTIPA